MEAIEVNTGEHPACAVIWLHGLGADGQDFAPIVPELALPPELSVRFIFPHAPAMPITINGGYVMPAWYDVRSQNLRQNEDETGIRASQQALERLIEREMQRGIDPAKIVLAGFSQGGAIALHTGLRYRSTLAGIMALSTYLPLPHAMTQEASGENAAIPVFMAHGTEDNVIPISHAEATREMLQRSGYPVEWHSYAMAHSVCPREVADIGAWLGKILQLRGTGLRQDLETRA